MAAPDYAASSFRRFSLVPAGASTHRTCPWGTPAHRRSPRGARTWPPDRAGGLLLRRLGFPAGLRDAGFPAICIETRHANAALKTMPDETDRDHARALTEIMRTGWFRQVHVKPSVSALAPSPDHSPHGSEDPRSIENATRAVLADREDQRMTRGSDTVQTGTEQERVDIGSFPQERKSWNRTLGEEG